MTWPKTMTDLVHLALVVASIAQGFVYIGLAVLLVAYLWWVFQARRHPTFELLEAIRLVWLLAFLAAAALAFIPVVRWVRHLTS
jgi:hypothetical protein